ncbi:MAG: serine/threonine protein kinase [Pirellulales bacterium]|nr:serine/threonine protein kinase [Pirellulales bacterium]
MEWDEITSASELDLLIKYVEQYEVDLRQGVDPSPLLESWPNPRTLPALMIELLLVEADMRHWNMEWFQQKLEIASQDAIEFAQRFCQRFCDEALKSRSAPTWDEIGPCAQKVGISSVRCGGEAYGLGDVILDKYTLVERIGAGQFGAVFRARTHDGQPDVAIKIPLRDSNGSIARTSCLIAREAEAISAMAGAGVPAFLALAPNEPAPALVMELIRGESLRTILNQGRVHPYWAARWTATLARVAERAHRNGWLHRDIKPENIVITADGAPILLDYGFALDEASQFSANVDHGFSAPYVAPEVLGASPSSLDGRVDVWALGAVLYEMLSGQRYRPVTNVEEAMAASMASLESAPFVQLAEFVPQSIIVACIHSLAPDPNRRYATALEFAIALESAIASVEDDTPAIEGRESNRTLAAWRLGVTLGRSHRELLKVLALADAIPAISGRDEASQKRREDLLRAAALKSAHFAAVLSDANGLAATLGLEQTFGPAIAKMLSVSPGTLTWRERLEISVSRLRRRLSRWLSAGRGKIDEYGFGPYESTVESAMETLHIDEVLAIANRARHGRSTVAAQNVGYFEKARLFQLCVADLYQAVYEQLKGQKASDAEWLRLGFVVTVAPDIAKFDESLEEIASNIGCPHEYYERLFSSMATSASSQEIELESARSTKLIERYLASGTKV